jgi:hypothetical protein
MVLCQTVSKTMESGEKITRVVLGPKWHSPVGSITFHRAQKTLHVQGPKKATEKKSGLLYINTIPDTGLRERAANWDCTEVSVRILTINT